MGKLNKKSKLRFNWSKLFPYFYTILCSWVVVQSVAEFGIVFWLLYLLALPIFYVILSLINKSWKKNLRLAGLLILPLLVSICLLQLFGNQYKFLVNSSYRKIEFTLIQKSLESKLTLDKFRTTSAEVGWFLRIFGIEQIENWHTNQPQITYFINYCATGRGWIGSGASSGYMYINPPIETIDDVTLDNATDFYSFRKRGKLGVDYFKLNDNWIYLTGNGLFGSMVSARQCKR